MWFIGRIYRGIRYKITFVNEPLYVIDKKSLLEEYDAPVAVDTMEEMLTMLNIDTIEAEKNTVRVYYFIWMTL